ARRGGARSSGGGPPSPTTRRQFDPGRRVALVPPRGCHEVRIPSGHASSRGATRSTGWNPLMQNLLRLMLIVTLLCSLVARIGGLLCRRPVEEGGVARAWRVEGPGQLDRTFEGRDIHPQGTSKISIVFFLTYSWNAW